MSSYISNFSYLFVPFTTENLEHFPNFCKDIPSREGWIPSDAQNRYLHRYVSDKLTGSSGSCYRYHLDPDYARAHGLYLGTHRYGTTLKTYRGAPTQFPFTIANLELFVFNTAVCVLAFELRFQEDDPRMIAAAQYYLRKITTEGIQCIDAPENTRSESFVEIARRMLERNAGDIKLDFFFYATKNNEKANFLTYIDVPRLTHYQEDLFYLKWCYNEGFDYDDTVRYEDNENHAASPCTIWGISVSAAVCLVNRSDAQKRFIEEVFQENFRNQYLLTYILLLHQKYMMYLFLTKMSVGIEGNLSQLEKYKTLLYDFETHYMFSYISEVPQYQRFYAKVRRVFALDVLFQDVQEPLSQLTEIQKQLAESKQRRHDDRLNTTLITLSLLTIVSSLTDASGITENLSWLISPQVSKVIQLITLIGVGVVSGIMLARLFFLRKNKDK